MLKLAAFADEISPDLGVQIEHCRANGITHLELRGVAGRNVLDFDQALRREIKARLADAGLAVACIGSPIGKVKLHEPFAAHFDRFKIAVELAEFFEAPLVRIFSYYPGAGTTREHLLRHGRAEVLRRLEQQVAYIQGRPLVLVHENEADIFGETGAACLDLLRTINAPQLRAAFDFANFVQAGENPLVNWPSLAPYVVHIHVKDARLLDGSVVPAGQGDGQVGPILSRAYAAGYRGFLTLEPHLSSGGQFAGFTGPDLFKVAVAALRALCRANGIPLAS